MQFTSMYPPFDSSLPPPSLPPLPPSLPPSRARMDMLKFPSDFNINSTYYELEGAADDVMKNINELIKVGQRAKSPDSHPLHGQQLAEHRQLSLSEPNLSMGGEEEEAAESQLLPWQLSPRGPSQRSNVMGLRPESITSQSSAGQSVTPSPPPLTSPHHTITSTPHIPTPHYHLHPSHPHTTPSPPPLTSPHHTITSTPHIPTPHYHLHPSHPHITPSYPHTTPSPPPLM